MLAQPCSMSNVLQSLQRDGYAVVRNILTIEKCNEIALQIKKQSKGLPNMAHSNIVWDVRCLPEIKYIFRMLWNDDDLIVGFDGVGTRKKELGVTGYRGTLIRMEVTETMFVVISQLLP